jgi:DNA-binding MarR family transcriptional regulator
MALGASCACANLRRAARAVTQMYDAMLRPVGLRATQLPLLVVLQLRDSLPMTRLAETMLMDRTTLTRNLRPLERLGLIRIVPGKDLRVREVRITARGREVVATALPLWERAQARVARGLGARRLRRLLADLTAAATVAQGT